MNGCTVLYHLLFVCPPADSEFLEDKNKVFSGLIYSAKDRACMEYLLNKILNTGMNELPDGSWNDSASQL